MNARAARNLPVWRRRTDRGVSRSRRARTTITNSASISKVSTQLESFTLHRRAFLVLFVLPLSSTVDKHFAPSMQQSWPDRHRRCGAYPNVPKSGSMLCCALRYTFCIFMCTPNPFDAHETGLPLRPIVLRNPNFSFESPPFKLS